MMDPTLRGRLLLIRLTAELDQLSWGWPFWVVSLAGVIVALSRTATRRVALSLGLVIAGYYLGFIDVILYTYDRYVLPICVIQALFGGVALDRFLRASHTPTSHRAAAIWRPAVVGGIFVYTLLYAATVDVLMIRDSRYTIEKWLHAQAGPDRLIGTIFPVYVLPRLDGLESMDIGTIEGIRRYAPDYFVLNADYARAVPPDLGPGPLIAALQDQRMGYKLVFRYRSPAPWPWLPAAHRDLVGPRAERQVFSVLRDINPTIEIYARLQS